MFKRLLPLFVLLFTLSLRAQAEPKKEVTMLVVPRDAKAIQVAQQISAFYPTLIVSYQQTHNLLKLYAWNGEGWVDISTEEYMSGTFFANPPQHTILVEREDTPAPDLLVPDGTWCETGNRLTTTDPRIMIHLIGRHLNFPYRHWMHLSKQYKYPLETINPELTNIYWWHYRGDQAFPTLDASDIEADMDNWLYLDIIPPPPVIDEEPEAVPEEDATEEESVGSSMEEVAEVEPAVEETAPVIDPFSTNSIPAAEVILPPAE